MVIQGIIVPIKTIIINNSRYIRDENKTILYNSTFAFMRDMRKSTDFHATGKSYRQQHESCGAGNRICG